MAFELKDFERSFSPKGDQSGVFNISRQDNTLAVETYYAYQNEAGSYVIQRTTTEGTAAVKVYKYYAVGKKPDGFVSDWANRANLSYVEFHEIFPQ